MLNTTVLYLKCPRRKRTQARCLGSFELVSKESLPSKAAKEVFEVRSGHLKCRECGGRFPILAGVALLVEDLREYLLAHAKGISQAVPDSEIPREYLAEFREAKEEARTQMEHIEEDLEAERVNSLYVMNHYLRVSAVNAGGCRPWWQPSPGGSPGSPLIDSLVRQYWDQGPFLRIKEWVDAMDSGSADMGSGLAAKKSGGSGLDFVELGCSVGGLYVELKPRVRSYLGVDSSFASIALARHLALGVPWRGKLRIPGDLLEGPVSREIKIAAAESFDGSADFILGDIQNPPLEYARWNVAVALNTIDMLDEPASLPKLQMKLLKKGGTALQSCPYIWHERVARQLRKIAPDALRDSARVVEWLYERAGFRIERRADQVPWLFFKHLRQLEIYSVHLFTAKKQ